MRLWKATPALLFFLLAACPSEVPNGGLDGDGDGITVEDGDCNDSDPNIGPGLAEVCDGIDNDCDGQLDNGFPDADVDGVAACAGDCDDSNAEVRPGALELCDGTDNDCDNEVDEISDLDQDGFSNCGGDCDDSDASVNPSAAEVCDLQDNDCNGQVDEGFDVDGDTVSSCAGDCDDANAQIFPSATEVCDNIDNNCNTLVDEGFDIDGDGETVCQGDCEDFLPQVNSSAPEICDLRDNNCDGQVDEGFDVDGDGQSACNGDCNDNSAAVGFNRPELNDGLDNDCNGLIDEPFIDNDGDGFSESQNDCNDAEPLVNPAAIEFQGDNVDNNCNGQVDEALQACDGGALSAGNPLDFAKAIGLCNGEVLNAQFLGVNAAGARALPTVFGSSTPQEGARMAHLSSGNANNAAHDLGTGLSITGFAHPDPQADPGICGAADPAAVFDLIALQLTIKVPSNAQSFSYNFQFFSSEYPTFRCTDFDDTFIAFLQSQAFQGNISFDAAGNVVSINNGFFQVCNDDNGIRPQPGTVIAQDPVNIPPNDCTVDPNVPLANTGYVPSDAFGATSFSNGAGATLPLNTISPVVPGETITLTFIIFDEGDNILDSSVLLDNFRWEVTPVQAPVTSQQ